MNLPFATLFVILAAVLFNRIIALGVGLWFHVPALFLMILLISLDGVQIPFYYRLYEHGLSLLDGFPQVQRFFRRDWSHSRLGHWASSLGGLGVMCVSALPTFGGGIWSATFLASGLRMRKSAGAAWIMTGSLLSYLTLYWILDALIRAVRYFV